MPALLNVKGHLLAFATSWAEHTVGYMIEGHGVLGLQARSSSSASIQLYFFNLPTSLKDNQTSMLVCLSGSHSHGLKKSKISGFLFELVPEAKGLKELNVFI